MRALFFILRNLSRIVFILCALYVGCFIYEAIKRNKHKEYSDKTEKIYAIAILAAIISSVIISAPFQELIKLDNISFKPEGEYCYYVTLENDESHIRGTYPARVEVSTTSDSEDDSYGIERKIYSAHYNIIEAYIDNKVLFLSGEIDIGSSSIVYDSDDSWYSCTLLNERAYYPKEQFDNGITVKGIIFLIIKITVLFVALIMLKRNNKKVESNNSNEK